MTTYNTLFTDIASWLNRNDSAVLSQIPNFISLGEEQICRECVNIGLLRKVISAAELNGGGFIPGQSYIPKPTGWRVTLAFTNGANNLINQMENRSTDFIDMYWPDTTQQGIPLYYSDDNINYWKVAPVPEDNYPFQVAYLEKPLPLSVYNQTNWLTDFIPDILLFACLINAMPYVKDDERLPGWQQQYAQKIGALNAQDKSRILDRASDRAAV